jgi:aconitate hydratase
MGQAPATGKISLRTVPRNFPGRSGTREDQVYLCSPETAAVSALSGVITDPRSFDRSYPKFVEPDTIRINTEMLIAPGGNGQSVKLEKGPNIQPLPFFDPLPETLQGPVLLKMGDDISTDEIMPAGAQVLPLRSNIPEISKFSFSRIDDTYYDRAVRMDRKDSFVVSGLNYGQGSSREHAVLGPRFLGLKAILAKSYARIHWQNLCNFGVLPLTFSNPDDYDRVDQDDILSIGGVRDAIRNGKRINIVNKTKNESYWLTNSIGARQLEMILKGSLINVVRRKFSGSD